MKSIEPEEKVGETLTHIHLHSIVRLGSSLLCYKKQTGAVVRLLNELGLQ